MLVNDVQQVMRKGQATSTIYVTAVEYYIQDRPFSKTKPLQKLQAVSQSQCVLARQNLYKCAEVQEQRPLSKTKPLQMCRSAGAEAYYVQCAATVSGVVKTSRLAATDDDCETGT